MFNKKNVDATDYDRAEPTVREPPNVNKRKTSVVKGNIFCARIVMANGAQFTGNIDMSQKTKSSAKPTSPQSKQPVEAVRVAGGQNRTDR